MQQSNALDFIRDKTHAVLITTKRGGRPQSSNVSYAMDGDTIIVSVTDGRAKTSNLRRDPHATLHVSRDDFYAYVAIEADVELTQVAADPHDDTADQLVEYFRKVAGEHDDWEEYRRAMVDDGRLLLKLTPTRAYGMPNR